MAKKDRVAPASVPAENGSKAQGAGFRERLELGLLLVVEILCLLLFIDFLFVGLYVK